MRSLAAFAVAALLALGGVHASAIQGSRADTDGRVRLRFYDRSGDELSAAAAISRMTNGGAGWANAALLDPIHLFDLVADPLSVDVTGRLSFELPGQPVALAVNWPTTRGYSMVILDDGGDGLTTGGDVNFTYQAALDAKRRLDLELAARPSYVRSPSFRGAYDVAEAALGRAGASSSQSTRGKEGYLALDALANANDFLLAGYGTRSAQDDPPVDPPWLGITMDTISHYRSTLDLTERLSAPYGWVRVVMDPGTPFPSYAPAVRYAHAHGLKIMGQPIDSSYAHRFLGARYLTRIQRAVTQLPGVDAWEIGNEINGRWLGPNMGGRVDQAARWLKANHPNVMSVVTLYWQIGTDAPRWSTFDWIRDHLRPSTIADTDVFLLSTWIEDAPMGLAYDQVIRTLHDALKGAQVGIGESGYWGRGTSRAWWYGDRRDVELGRRIVLDQLYRAALGYPWSRVGGFWWYFAEDMPADPALACDLSEIRDDLAGTPTRCRSGAEPARPVSLRPQRPTRR